MIFYFATVVLTNLVGIGDIPNEKLWPLNIKSD